MSMLPLCLTWRLSSPFAPTAFPMHLDGLLAWALVEEHYERTRCDPEDYQRLFESLPLERYTASSGAWCWKASRIAPNAILGSERRFMTSKTPSDLIADVHQHNVNAAVAAGVEATRVRGASQVDTVRGYYKASSFWVSLQHVDAVVAYCVGDPERITELAERVTHIGTRGRSGFGSVAVTQDSDGVVHRAFTIEQCEEANVRWVDRVMPDAQPGYEPIISPLSPPYWDRTRAVEAWAPVAQ